MAVDVVVPVVAEVFKETPGVMPADEGGVVVVARVEDEDGENERGDCVGTGRRD